MEAPYRLFTIAPFPSTIRTSYIFNGTSSYRVYIEKNTALSAAILRSVVTY